MRLIFKILTIWMLGLFIILIVGASLINGGGSEDENQGLNEEEKLPEFPQGENEFDEEESGYTRLPNKNGKLSYNNLIQGRAVFDELFRPVKFTIFVFVTGFVFIVCFLITFKMIRKSKIIKINLQNKS